jgi:hypothetical protein
MSQIQEQVTAFFPQSEREFLLERVVGARTRIMLDEENVHLVCYEGEVEGQESFVMQAEEKFGDRIFSWRSPLRALSFYSTLPEGKGIRSIAFNGLYRRCNHYTPLIDEKRYHENKTRLIKAGLWRED